MVLNDVRYVPVCCLLPDDSCAEHLAKVPVQTRIRETGGDCVGIAENLTNCQLELSLIIQVFPVRGNPYSHSRVAHVS